MKRFLCVNFPKWPLQRLGHDHPELRNKPVGLSAAGATRGPRIVLCSEAAARLGVRPGLPAAEALAVAPDLCLYPEAPDRDRQVLEQLAEQLGRYSPFVGLEEGPSPQSLLADITGCAAQFGGEDRLIDRALRELHEQGWIAHLAIADTVGAAWAVAHFAPTPQVLPPGETGQFLRSLPITALRLSSEALHLLTELGIGTIGQLLALPRAEVPARFGAGVLQRLDQALGRLPELILPCRPIPEIQATFRFEYATDRWEVLQFTLERLIDEVHEKLQRQQWGAWQLECCLYYETASPSRLEVGLFRPSNSRPHLAGLLRTQLEQVQVAEPVNAMGLRVVAAETLPPSQAEFRGMEQGQTRNELAILIDRLSNYLGREAVTRPLLVPDPQPEYAYRFQSVVRSPSAGVRRPVREAHRRRTTDNERWTTDRRACADRPVRLLPRPRQIEVIRARPGRPPVQFRWAGTEYHVTRSRGPERIDTGWWRGQDIHRDYYIVTTHVGTRFWLFRRRPDGCWLLHGCFD